VSKLRHPFLSNRYFFITVPLLKRREKLTGTDAERGSAEVRAFCVPLRLFPAVTNANPPAGGLAQSKAMPFQ